MKRLSYTGDTVFYIVIHVRFFNIQCHTLASIVIYAPLLPNSFRFQYSTKTTRFSVSIWFSLNIHSPCSNKVDTDAKWFWLIRPYHKENLAYATSWVKSGQEPIMTM